MKVDDSTQVAGVDFGAIFDAIHKLQREIRKRDERIQRLEEDNELLRLRLRQERESVEW